MGAVGKTSLSARSWRLRAKILWELAKPRATSSHINCFTPGHPGIGQFCIHVGSATPLNHGEIHPFTSNVEWFISFFSSKKIASLVSFYMLTTE